LNVERRICYFGRDAEEMNPRVEDVVAAVVEVVLVVAVVEVVLIVAVVAVVVFLVGSVLANSSCSKH
jgi:hypothetical protein